MHIFKSTFSLRSVIKENFGRYETMKRSEPITLQDALQMDRDEAAGMHLISFLIFVDNWKLSSIGKAGLGALQIGRQGFCDEIGWMFGFNVLLC